MADKDRGGASFDFPAGGDARRTAGETPALRSGCGILSTRIYDFGIVYISVRRALWL